MTKEEIQALIDLHRKATPGPWIGCNHVLDHAFDKNCGCKQASIWSKTADTIVCQKYENPDGSGPEPVSRSEELHNMTAIVGIFNALPALAALALDGLRLQVFNERIKNGTMYVLDLTKPVNVMESKQPKEP